MGERRISVIVGLVGATVIGADLGCGDDAHVGDASANMGDASSGEPACEGIEGRFDAIYVPISGNCGALASPHQVPFVERDSLAVVVEMIGQQEIETDVVIKGCSISLTQTAYLRPTDEPPRALSRIEGPTLIAKNASKITGTVTYTRYATTTAPGCSGSYDATFAKRSTP